MTAERPTRQVRRRSELEVRWRQFRNAPRPIVRAVLADLAVASLGGLLLLVWDLARAGEGRLAAGEVRAIAVVAYVVVVLGVGSLLTYLWVPLPSGATGTRRRSAWSALLGFLAALPIAYLVLVIVFQVLRPLLGP